MPHPQHVAQRRHAADPVPIAHVEVAHVGLDHLAHRDGLLGDAQMQPVRRCGPLHVLRGAEPAVGAAAEVQLDRRVAGDVPADMGGQQPCIGGMAACWRGADHQRQRASGIEVFLRNGRAGQGDRGTQRCPGPSGPPGLQGHPPSCSLVVRITSRRTLPKGRMSWLCARALCNFAHSLYRKPIPGGLQHLAGLVEIEPGQALEQGAFIAIAEIAEEIGPQACAGEELGIHLVGGKARHRPDIEAKRACGQH